LFLFIFTIHNVLICFEECDAETTENNSSEKSLDEQIPINSSVEEQVAETTQNNSSHKSLDEQVPINSSVEEQVPTNEPGILLFLFIF
jgi:hypothetical protein